MHYMRPHNYRRGLSLLEVIFAIAILGGSLATIGQLIHIGARNAAQARDLTMAQLYAESQMNRFASSIEIPDTLQGVLTARMDQLSEVAKHALQIAAVIGRTFNVKVLERVLEMQAAQE